MRGANRRSMRNLILLLLWLPLGALAQPPNTLAIDEVHRGPAVVMRLSGHLTIGPDDKLRAQVNSAIARDVRKIVFNLSGLKGMDTYGLAELVRSYTSLKDRGGAVVLCDLPDRAVDLLFITQLITVFDVYTNEDEALSALGFR